MNPLAEVTEKVPARSLEVGDRVEVRGRRASVVEVLDSAQAVEVLLRFSAGDRQEWRTVNPSAPWTRVWNENGQELTA